MRTYLYLFLLVLISVPFAVHGQTSNNNFVPLQPGIPGVREFATSGSIPDLLNNIYKICIGVAATLAVLQIMRAGVMYMGGDSITEKKEARDLISMSVIGLVLVLSPVIVFSIINPDILSLKLGAIQLAPVSSQSAQDPYANTINPQQVAAQCKSYDPTKFKSYVPAKDNLGSFKTCASDFGGGYVNVETACCAGAASGSVCCGFSQSVKNSGTPAPIVAPGNFKYHYMQYDSLNECVGSFPSSNFTTLNKCIDNLNSIPLTSTVVVDKDCSGNSVALPRSWLTSTKDKPMCPQ